MIRQKYQKGFTIPELMMGIALFAIVVSYAVPSFDTLMKKQELNSKVGEFNTLLAYARTEAVSRAQSVIVCPADPDTDGCLSSADWSSAWRVFLDANRSGSQDAGDQLIRESGDYGHNVRLVADGTDPIVYNDAGESISEREIKLCIPSVESYGSRIVSIGFVGSTRVSKSSSGC